MKPAAEHFQTVFRNKVKIWKHKEEDGDVSGDENHNQQ